MIGVRRGKEREDARASIRKLDYSIIALNTVPTQAQGETHEIENKAVKIFSKNHKFYGWYNSTRHGNFLFICSKQKNKRF